MVMSNQKEKDENSKRRTLVGIAWNCAAELKLLLSALLFLCTLATLLQFLPSRFFISPSDIRRCLTTPTTASLPPPSQQMSTDEMSDDGVLKRAFNPYGSAAYNFIFMSAYRGGADTFAVIGLSSKPLHVYGKPSYECQWVPRHNSTANATVTTIGQKILPDWGYGRVYTVVVVNCTFRSPAGADGKGGKLILHAGSDIIVALDETAEEFADFTAQVESVPTYDYVYCGSPLYGKLSPARVREWVAYHVRLLGKKSHFVMHDAGGVHEGVREVLRPWMEKGFVSLQDVREQESFDGYYHNQFLIVNDCLHRYRFRAKWIFFFDVDEFIFVPKKSTMNSLMNSLSGFTQFTIEQMPMSGTLCHHQDGPLPLAFRKWGFEKLVYRDVKRGVRRDRKYAVQPRNVFATGVHMSQNAVGKTTYKTEGRIRYFHYHGTIANRREPCNQFLNQSQITVHGIPYVMDTTMREVAAAVKRFELKTIGPVLQRTRQ
ncbi:hypothetical protein C2S51_037049 [Perilla frutescens var. frutescens]|nr:hypothetical protein C2S51_037049 [Perilla frutescens var. frutescens]